MAEALLNRNRDWSVELRWVRRSLGVVCKLTFALGWTSKEYSIAPQMQLPEGMVTGVQGE
jgi:hypothetical protein